MIARLAGILKAVENGEALLDVNGVTYAVLVTVALEEELVRSGAVGATVEFSIFHYIEGGVAMGHLVPRLVGFRNDSDRTFFTMLITVQGLGVKKALRALALPIGQVARAIEQNDIKTLTALPEIGAKTAQKIVMELRGKAACYATGLSDALPVSGDPEPLDTECQREALEVLKQLQYTEVDAVELIRRVSAAHPGIATAEELIQEVFKRIRI